MKSMTPYLWIAFGVCLLMATFFSPFASSSPDGLEKVAESHGFLEKAEADGVTVWEHAPVKDYAMPGIKNEKAATAVAGLLGAAGTFVVAYGVAILLRARKKAVS